MARKKPTEAAGLGRSGLQAPPHEPVAIGDAPPSNTASHGYKGNGDTGYRGLRFGVDSLYLSFYGNLLPAIDHGLALAKYAAQSRHQAEQSHAQWIVGKHVFEVSDKGRQSFAYILRDNGYQIALRSGDGGRLPVAYVQVSSELLAHKPVGAG